MGERDLMDEARALRQSVNWGSNASVEVVAEVLNRLVAAAEQRGREESAKVVEAVGSDHDPQLADFLAAAIRRGAHGAIPPSPPSGQNGESATPSHAPTPEGKD